MVTTDRRGWAADTSPAAQSRRGQAAAKASPWGRGPACCTDKARASFAKYTEKRKP